MKTEETLEIIYKAVDILNTEVENKISKDLETRLFGSKGLLDSIGLVNFITIIEEVVEEETGKYITVANEKAMLAESSPFRTMSTLQEHITELINEEN